MTYDCSLEALEFFGVEEQNIQGDVENWLMNMLVIGNGFDLAHGLPTKYEDFLEWIKVIKQAIKIENGDTLANVDWGNINLQIKVFITTNKMYGNKDIFSQEYICSEFLNDNFWIDYFLQCDMYQKENWIDFESEISRVIQSVDNDMKQKGFDENAFISKLPIPFLAEKFLNDYDLLQQERNMRANEENRKMEEKEGVRWNIGKSSDYMKEYIENHPFENLKEEITYKQLIMRLEYDLDKLIRALEIYLAEYVNVIKDTEECKAIQGVNPDCVLSFNYSNTYERLYGNGKEIQYNYIHGKADINNTVESNNMVLGIDEYLEPERMNKEISFISFKKYYQRICKGTGCEYRDWIYKIKESAKSIELKLRNEYPEQIPFIKFTNDARHNLYIFGHSLDITDQDVLRELILNDNVYTTIFYMNKKDLKGKIANLVKVIGQDELIRRTGGSTKTIEFKLQQDMVEI